MITYTDKSNNVETLTKEDLLKSKNSIYFTSLYAQGGKFKCADEFGDCTIYILDVCSDSYKIKVIDNWHICEDIIDTLTIEQLVDFITKGGY